MPDIDPFVSGWTVQSGYTPDPPPDAEPAAGGGGSSLPARWASDGTHPGILTSPTADRWYAAGWGTTGNINATVGASGNRAYYAPIIGTGQNLAALAVQPTGVSGPTNLKFGVFKNAGQPYAGEKVYDSPVINFNTIGAKVSVLDTPTKLDNGAMYWLSMIVSGTTTVMAIPPGEHLNVLGTHMSSATSFASNGFPGVGWYKDGSSAVFTDGWPDPGHAGATILDGGVGNLPAIFCRFI